MNSRDRILENSNGNGSPEQALDFESLLQASMEELMAKTQAHQAAWDFGTEEEWHLDQDLGELKFKFPGRMAIAPVQIIGTFDTQAGSWMWAWANPLIADNLKTDSLCVKRFGEQYGIQRLTTSE